VKVRQQKLLPMDYMAVKKWITRPIPSFAWPVRHAGTAAFENDFDHIKLPLPRNWQLTLCS
jgi:hypothetical protein